MVTLKKGQFFGQTNNTTHLDSITLTDTVYTHEKVDWHYHDNAYFTLILEGRVIEGNKKEVYQCPAGTLLFHNWQEAHYNVKPKVYTRGFHIEIEPGWFKRQETSLNLSQGSFKLLHPGIIIETYNILKESKIADGTTPLAIESLLINVFSKVSNMQEKLHRVMPRWAVMLRDILNDTLTDEWTLVALAQTTGIHPVHLSRHFPKYFGSNLGDYIRNIKIQKALSLLTDKNLSLTEIAYEAGFADQSHFTRCFKAVSHSNPSLFRKVIAE